MTAKNVVLVDVDSGAVALGKGYKRELNEMGAPMASLHQAKTVAELNDVLDGMIEERKCEANNPELSEDDRGMMALEAAILETYKVDEPVSPP